MSKENARSLERAIGVNRFAEMLTNAQEIEHMLGEMIVFEPATKAKLRPIQTTLSRQVKVAATRLENIRQTFGALTSPHGDRDELDEAIATLEERISNLDQHFLKMADTLHEATMEFVALSWRRQRETLAP
jgi:hypothetical protein